VFSRQAAVSLTPSARPATPVAPPPGREVCASTAGFSSARAMPRGQGLRLQFARRVANPVTVDVFRAALRRAGGRFATRPAFYRRASCGLLTSYKLSSAAFGGRGGNRLGIAFRLGQRARVQVSVLRGTRRVTAVLVARRL